MTHEELRKRHFERLNDYRNSLEYQQSPNCFDRREGDFPSLLGNRWEIDEDIYYDFFEMLPPLDVIPNGFYMLEFTFDDFTAKFTVEGNRFYCEFARYSARRAA